jgi:hypothetical protein
VATIELPGLLAIPLAPLGAAWIYRDANQRGMDTADMWAVGFFVGFFVPPLLGGAVVFWLYLQKRNRRGGVPTTTPGE